VSPAEFQGACQTYRERAKKGDLQALTADFLTVCDQFYPKPRPPMAVVIPTVVKPAPVAVVVEPRDPYAFMNNPTPEMLADYAAMDRRGSCGD
jgi:hypothetical protein